MKKIIKVERGNLNKGITLVALVITIIVLLILAGITLALVMGENGIFNKANKASEETNKSQAIEEVRLKVLEVQAEKEGKATLKDVVQKLKDSEDTYTIRIISTEQAPLSGTVTVENITENVTKIGVTNTKYGYEVEIGKTLNIDSNATAVGGSGGSGNGVDLNKKDLWTNWLSLAGIDLSSHSSVDFMDDEQIMETLMNSESAVQYMVESTKFILPAVANSQVAMTKLGQSDKAKTAFKNLNATAILKSSANENKMVENLTRSEAPMSSLETDNAKISMSSSPNCQAFDGVWNRDDGHTWWSTSSDPVSSTNHPWIIYQFKNTSIVPYKFRVMGSWSTSYSQTGTAHVEASKTGGDDYVRITEDFNLPPVQLVTVYPNQNLDEYSYFKLIITQPCGNWQFYKAGISEWEIYGK